MESAEKEALANWEEQSTENSPFFFFPPNNIFIITTLHLLPLLQISCWKKWTHTKDPGESWDSALIGKPFNILKYNLTFLSIEEPPRGRSGGGLEGQYALFSRKPFSSYKQLGAFPCVYIVLAYLGAGWNRTPPPPADAATRFEREAQLPWRIQNVESRSRGAPPLLPEPAVGCKPPKATGKLFGSSSALGMVAIPRRTGHGPCRPLHCCPGHGGKAGTSVHQRWTPASLFRERSRGFPTPVVLGRGANFTIMSWSCLSKAQNARTKWVRAHALAPGHQLEKTNRKMGDNGARCLPWLWGTA